MTKKLPLFLSHFNEIAGGCEKIEPVSESLLRNLKIVRMIDFFNCVIVRVKCDSEWNVISIFLLSRL